MKEVTSGFDEYVGITRTIMHVLGIWPGTDAKSHWLSRYHFLIPTFFMIFFINIPQTRMLVEVWGDLNMIMEILTTADIMVGLACLKLLGIWYNQSDLKNLLIEMFRDWKNVDDHRKSMWENIRLCKLIMTGYVILTYGTIVVYAAGMLILLQSHSRQLDSGIINSSTSKPMFVISKFFFETESSPTFEVIWLCQFVTATLSISAFTSFDGFFIFSILHLCSQLSILRTKITMLNFQMQSKQFIFAKVFKPIVKRHVHLQNLTYCIENNFNKVFLVQMICYSITLCLQSYQLVNCLTEKMENTAATLAFIVIFTSANIMSLFMYCFVAEKLQKESTDIFFATYDVCWYELNSRESILLINLMNASKLPLKITAGKFATLSFAYFAKVLKTSVGYLSMLLAVKSKHQND